MGAQVKANDDGQAKQLKALRARLADVLPEDIAELWWSTVEEAMRVWKTGWGDCKKCRGRVQVEVLDATAAVNAAKLLLEQLEGRPGIAAGDERQRITVVRDVAGRDGPAGLVPAGTPQARRLDESELPEAA